MRPLAAALALPCLPSRRRHRWTRDLPDPFLFFFERHYCISEFQTLDPTTHFVSQVRGAAEGAGLGNAFLSNIQSVDGIFHVVRAFESEEVIHVDDTVDPIRDLETIQLELSKKDLTFVEAAEAKETKDVKCTPFFFVVVLSPKSVIYGVYVVHIDILDVSYDGADASAAAFERKCTPYISNARLKYRSFETAS